MVRIFYVVAVLVGGACKVENPVYCDAERPCTNGLVCDPDSRTCEMAVTDGGLDALPIDAIPDAAVRAFDIAYPSDWKFSVAGPVDGYLLVVNTGAVPLNMGGLQLVSISDDHPTANVRINAYPFETTVLPGQAGGFLTPLSKNVLVDSGLVPELRTDVNSNYLDIELVNAPAGTYDINVDLTLNLDNVAVPLSFVVHVVPGMVVFADPLIGKRSIIYR